MLETLVASRRSWAIASLTLAAWGCKENTPSGPGTAPASAQIAPTACASATSGKTPGAPSASALSAKASSAATLPGSSFGTSSAPNGPPCPEDMAFIEGDHCSLVEQKCLEFAKDQDGSSVESVCVRFEKPSKCVSTGRWHLRYCMDRYEYPNKLGEKPLVLVDFREATKLCEAKGRRLCTPAEFNFACEGEDMWPYATGFDRDSTKCNIDKEWHKKSRDMLPYEECMKNKPCAEQLAKLDQRHAIGERKTCVSPFGVYDLNGNANEWVVVPWGKPPFRGAIKGGWWGPVRNRCRPIVTSHDEKYTGYEVGFRCCKDTGGPQNENAGPVDGGHGKSPQNE